MLTQKLYAKFKLFYGIRIYFADRRRRIFEGRMDELLDAIYFAFQDSSMDFPRITSPESPYRLINGAIHVIPELYPPENKAKNYETPEKGATEAGKCYTKLTHKRPNLPKITKKQVV